MEEAIKKVRQEMVGSTSETEIPATLEATKTFLDPLISEFKEQPERFISICEEKPEWLEVMVSPEETVKLKAKMRELLEKNNDMEPAAIDYFISIYTDVAYKEYLKAKTRV